MTINQHIEAAIAGLKAYNAMQSAWRENCRAGGYAAHFKDAPDISDHIRTELLEAIIAFDEDPVGSLAELQFQEECKAERSRELLPRASLFTDEQWDFANSRGLMA